MTTPDYDKALYYTLRGQWNELFILMVRTHDDLLAKKIDIFLNDFHYSLDDTKVFDSHDNLLYYIDHAMQYEPSEFIEV